METDAETAKEPHEVHPTSRNTSNKSAPSCKNMPARKDSNQNNTEGKQKRKHTRTTNDDSSQGKWKRQIRKRAQKQK